MPQTWKGEEERGLVAAVTRGAIRPGAPRPTTTGVGRAASEGAWAGLLVAAFVLYYVAPGLPLSLLLLVVCGALCYLRLPLAVSLIPVVMPFFMLPKHLTGHQEFALGETAIVLCALAYGLQRLATLSAAMTGPASRGVGAGVMVLLRHFVPRSRFERPVALFLAAATVAMLAAHFRHVALREYRLVILEPIIYYVLVVALLRDTRSMLRALWALVASGVLVALLGLGQYVFRRNTLVGVRYTGSPASPVPHPLHLVTSVYGSPDNLALLLDRVIPVAIVLGLAALAPTLPGIRRAPAQRDQAGRVAPRPSTLSAPSLPLIAALAVAPMVVALLLTGSRGGILTAVATGLAAVLFWRSQTERRYGPLLTLLSAGGILGGAALLVLSQIQHGASTATRLYVWRSALAMIRDHPLLGVGPDNFLYYYFPDPHKIDPHPFYNPHVYDCVPPSLRGQLPAKHYIDFNNAWQEPCLSHPHNVVLHVWLATGLVGLAALGILLVGFVVVARHNLSRLRGARTQARAVQVAAVAVVVATFVHGMVDNSIFVADLAVAFWLAVALTGQLSVASGQLQAGGSQRVLSSGQ